MLKIVKDGLLKYRAAITVPVVIAVLAATITDTPQFIAEFFKDTDTSAAASSNARPAIFRASIRSLWALPG